jgi:CheY-like chemotaxis protein
MDRTGYGHEGQISPNETVILIAEDDSIIRNLIHLMLVREGYAVLAASDGQEALEILDKFKDPIHLILTDVRMPRMDGWTFAEVVRQERPDAKIIVMSGETATMIGEENTADAFLRKPFIPPTLLQCIQRVLASDFRGVCEEVAGPLPR